MIWVGITGPMGGGKSSVAGRLRARGFTVIGADEIVHELLLAGSPAAEQIFKTLGGHLRAADGSVDRRALGREVFGQPEKLDLLERILHPQVRDRVSRIKTGLEQAGAKAAFYDVPLLFEKNMQSQFDAILVVTASPAARMRRLKARTGLSEDEILRRWRAQLAPEVKEAGATVLIRNDGDLEALDAAVDQALKALGISPAAADS